VLLARMLGAEGYGIYAYAYSLVMLLAIPVQFGLPKLIVRETASSMALDRPDLVQGVWRWAGRLVGVFSLALMLVAGLLLLQWGGGLGNVQGLTLAWALALVPLIALGDLRGAALRGLKHIVAGQLPEFVIRPGLFVLLLIGTGLLLDRELLAPLAIALQVSAALIAFIAGAWMLWRNTPLIVRQAQPASKGRAWLVSSLLFGTIAGFGVINKQVSILILGLFEAPDQVGIYRVAVQVATLASFGLQAVNMVVGPRFAGLYTQGKIARLQRLVTGSARVVLAFNLTLTALFVIAGKQFFSLIFGPDFAASFGPLVILLVGQMVNSAVGSVGLLLNMTGHERETLRWSAAAAGINIVLNLLLVPLYGFQGAAAATTISMILWNTLFWLAVRRRLGINSSAFNVRSEKVK
jgi:O-antigen/teichoic acid export membrane protein